MKKVLFLFVAAGLLSVSNIQAQESSVGIKGAANLSTLSTDDNNDSNVKLGFDIGVFTKIGITETFAIQPELMYSRQGNKVEYNNIVGSGETKFNLNYINLPIKLVYNLADDFEFQFGPYVGYLVDAKVKTDAEVLGFFDIDSDEELDRKNFNTIDYGLTAGIAFDLKPLVIGVNYNLGLNRVAKDDKVSDLMLKDAKNRVIAVSVGLKF